MKSSDNNLLEKNIKDQVNALYELMQSEKLEELEIREENFYLYLKRKGRKAPVAPSVAPAHQPAPVTEQAETTAPEICGETVKSPITGIFYQAPSPSSPAFVKEGDVVGMGKTLCIVEAMKVMNEIKSECRMKIVKILVENGKPITASQDLFLIEKA